jgi:uncharacterized RDD family membrane protein YckC
MNDAGLQQKRLIAAAIDVGIGFGLGIALAVVITILGMIAGMAGSATVANFASRVLWFLASVVVLGYVLGRDLLGGGRSLGKKIQEIRVVTAAGRPIGPVESVKRNAVFAAGQVLVVISAAFQLVPVIGDAVACLLTPLIVLGGLATFGAAVYEVVRITQDPQGIRLGDQLAGTKVVR